MEKKIFKRRITKRKRQLPYRKWSDYETAVLVDYIKENDFEKPNGRMFYQTFVDTFNINIQWTLVKNKIRNLKTLYEKALIWQDSDAAKNLPPGENIESIMNRICPFFYSLKEVFGVKVKRARLKVNPNQYNSTLEIEDSEDTIFKSTFSPPPSPPQHATDQGQKCSLIPGNIAISDNSREKIISASTSVNNHQTLLVEPETKPNRIAIEDTNPIESKPSQNHDACNCLMEVVKMMASYQKERSEHQKASLELEHKKFEFEKEKTLRDLELRQKEIEKNERLQILEMESKERITLKELEYKYKRL